MKNRTDRDDRGELACVGFVSSGRTHDRGSMRRGFFFLAMVSVMALGAVDSPVVRAEITDADIAALSDTAGETDGASGPAPIEAGKVLPRLVISLAVVIGLIVLAAWLARRFLPKEIMASKGAAIEVLSTRSLGARKSLMLVRAGDKTVLLGMTPQKIEFLTDIDHGTGGWEEAAIKSGLEDPRKNRALTGARAS